MVDIRSRMRKHIRKAIRTLIIPVFIQSMGSLGILTLKILQDASLDVHADFLNQATAGMLFTFFYVYIYPKVYKIVREYETNRVGSAIDAPGNTISYSRTVRESASKSAYDMGLYRVTENFVVYILPLIIFVMAAYIYTIVQCRSFEEDVSCDAQKSCSNFWYSLILPYVLQLISDGFLIGDTLREKEGTDETDVAENKPELSLLPAGTDAMISILLSLDSLTDAPFSIYKAQQNQIGFWNFSTPTPYVVMYIIFAASTFFGVAMARLAYRWHATRVCALMAATSISLASTLEMLNNSFELAYLAGFLLSVGIVTIVKTEEKQKKRDKP
jgi:hypothetical protein